MGEGVIEDADLGKCDGNYLLISPCRDEAGHMRETLDSVINQSVRPAKWVIVDDGSTDSTPQILGEYRAKHHWIEVVTRRDRGQRSVGPGVIEAFYAGWSISRTSAGTGSASTMF